MLMMGRFDYQKYFEQIRTMPEPIMVSELLKVSPTSKASRRRWWSVGLSL